VSRSSAGGLGPAGGVGLEGQILAWLAAHSLAQEQLPHFWVSSGRVTAVGSQTAREIDDIGAMTAASGHLLVQSKKAMALGKTKSSPLAKALRQVVAQYLRGVPDGSDGTLRPVDPARDRLLIVTDGGAPTAVRNGLVSVVDQLAALSSAELPFTDVQGDQDVFAARDVVLEHLHRELGEQQDGDPREATLRGLLAVLRVRVLHLDEGGPDRDTAGQLLRRVLVDGSQAPAAWNALEVICQGLARDRTYWASRDRLADRLEHDGFALRRDLSGTPPRTSPPGSGPDATAQRSAARPVTAWDAQQLGVHRTITANSAGGQTLPELTPYVRRAHDRALHDLLTEPRRPVMVVLVGGSSTGKTRAAFEAVRGCLPDWSLLCPMDAADLVSHLTIGSVGPRTVLWLNETQNFLEDRPEAAAAVRRLLASDEPVAVVGTMWPRYWQDLTAPLAAADKHGMTFQARELLRQAVRVTIPDAFAGGDLDELRRQLGTDPRLEAAAAAAGRDGKVIQVLAGGPELVQRYENPADARGRYGKAVVTAAMDVRRLGYESPTAPAMLNEVAPAYLDPRDRAGAPADWFGAGLADAAEEVYGIAALTARRDQPGVGPADGYVLHDYLDQYGRLTRLTRLVPATVWDTLIAYAFSIADRTRLAQQALSRGLYRYTVALAQPAAEAGDTTAMQILAARLNEAGHTEAATHWLREAAELGNTAAMLTWAQQLDEVGQSQEAERVLHQAANAGDTSATMSLAARLDEAGESQEAERILRQAADAGNTTVMERLAARLYDAGQGPEAETWLRRAAESGDPMAMRILAARLDETGHSHEAEQWYRQAAESGDHFARFDMTRLALRLEEADRAKEALRWWRRGAENGDASTMWILAGRLEQAGRVDEAEHWRRKALEAGAYFALLPAIEQIKKAGGGVQEFEQLLRGSIDADGTVIRALIEWLDQAGRGTEAEQWLREAAESGHLVALHYLIGRLEQAGRAAEADQWRRRLVETGTYGGVHQVALQLDKTDPARAERLRRYGIEPGGATSAPW